MRILRSVSRRGFSIGTAGWFTILRQNTWFPATRLPRSFPHPSDHFQTPAHALTAEHLAQIPAASRQAALSPRIVTLNGYEHRPARLALITLFAVAITLGMLWWIMGARL
ncbi:MAG: hypothetical protein KGM96_04895 [Acidobacteriota bacterium]|nr:hypothetical protein [Acidobacteriota bacterium]